MKAHPVIAALLIASAAAPALGAEVKTNPKAVLELFTSQGCSSCPPADALLRTMDQRPDIIALAYHVDYWDYIGWTDTFGAKANTDRQRAYAAAWKSNNIYTPELVINGAKDVVGSRQPDIDTAVGGASLPVPVMVKNDNDMLNVSIGGKPGAAPSGVWLVTFINKAQVDVERGENAGHKLAYSQVVTGRHILGMWDPDTGAHLQLPLDEVLAAPSDGAVILVQSEKNGIPGPIMGAASFIR